MLFFSFYLEVLERAQTLDDISSKLSIYQDKVRDVNHSLHRLEDRLLSHDALGDSSRDHKLLARMKVQIYQLKTYVLSSFKLYLLPYLYLLENLHYASNNFMPTSKFEIQVYLRYIIFY